MCAAMGAVRSIDKHSENASKEEIQGAMNIAAFLSNCVANKMSMVNGLGQKQQRTEQEILSAYAHTTTITMHTTHARCSRND